MRPRAPSGSKETASEEFRPFSSKARVRRKVPGLLFCPAGGIGDTRMFQKHVLPGSNPGWGTRFVCGGGCASAPLRHSDRIKRIVLLQLGMWQELGRHGSTGRARRCQRREAGSRPAACPIRFRRLTVRTAAFQAANAGSILAGNTTGTSLNWQSIRLAREACGFESHRLHHFILAVAQRPARPVRDEESEGSSPSGETIPP